MYKKFYTLLFIALAHTTLTHAQARTLNTAVTNGSNWSSTSTWSQGRVPQNNDSIVIPSGSTVWLDISANLNNVYLTIAGTLEVDKNSKLTLDNSSTVLIPTGGLLSTTHPSSTEIISIGSAVKWTGTDGAISGFAYANSSTTGFSSTPITLPVTFVSFSAIRDGNEAVTLDWTTVNEANNSHFEVERSLDGSNWTTIGTMAAGLSGQEDSYHFTDNAASQAEIWYRLRQVDLDGNASYSRIALVGNTSTPTTTIVAAGKTINVLFGQSTTSRITARLLTVNGQVLQQETFETASNTISLGVYNVPAGVYVVYLTDGKGWSIAKKVLL